MVNRTIMFDEICLLLKVAMCAEQYCSEDPNQPVFCLKGELNYSGALILHAISGFFPLILVVVHVNFSSIVFILVELKICFRLSFSIIYCCMLQSHIELDSSSKSNYDRYDIIIRYCTA